MKKIQASQLKPTLTGDFSADSYLKSIEKYETLSQAEEQALAARIQAGDNKAYNKFVESNLRLAVVVAREYQGHGLNMMELIEVANEALCKCARSFNPLKGFRFSSYAMPCMQGAVNDALDKENHRVEADSYESVDDPMYDDSESTRADYIADEDTETDKELVSESTRNYLVRIMDKLLTPNERYVLMHVYGFVGHGAKLREVAKELDLTEARVGQIHQAALSKMRREGNLAA